MSHTFVHATEELGEVGRLILQWEGYKDMPDPEVWRAQMAEELSDVLVFLIKLAYQCGIDIEDAVQAGRAKADRRNPDLAEGSLALENYRQRQAALFDKIMGPDGASPGLSSTRGERNHECEAIIISGCHHAVGSLLGRGGMSDLAAL